jgi:hypothetical protein
MNFAFNIKGQIDALAQEVDTLQKAPGGPHGYRLRRIILANFWLYGLQVFEIPHGRLLLAGNNASGKSTVLTAALPLALEGNLRPERLDTFGGKHKHADYYVLGNEASSTSFNYTKRTSYIALEFEWCQSDADDIEIPNLEIFSSHQKEQQDKPHHLTIGISLYGNEAAITRIQPMYFLITDGSRLLKDIKLTYVGNDNQTRTYNQHDFKEHLKGHGMICETQEKYAREVSKQIFGFEDTEQFRKLIELLLVLRCPNPSDKLTVHSVQQHLTDALPSIPSDIAKEAVETIGEIDNLQQQIEQLEQEEQAVRELHRAQQNLARSKARTAGFHVKMSQQLVEQLDHQIARLHRDLTDLELQHQKVTSSYEELVAEKEQVAGKITAIEMGEGIKASHQIVEARRHVTSTREQVAKQQKNLERVHSRLQNCQQKIESQNKSFQVQMEQSQQHIRNLCTRMEENALWYEVAEQFQKGLEHIGHIESEGSNTVKIIQEIACLTSVSTEQRLQWLRELDQLHQEKKNLELSIERAQTEEDQCSRELVRLFTQFKAELSNFDALSHRIELTLESIIMNTDSVDTAMLQPENNHSDLDTAQPQEESISFEGVDDINSYVEQCTAKLERHKQYIRSVTHYRDQTLQKWKLELDNLRLEKAQKQQAFLAKEREYELKRAQPEIAPEQPERRKNARKQLAEQNILAFPLYSLVDLIPTCGNEEGGYIEHMLEDTGLLDALVILDEDVADADDLLQAEALSDYRLNNVRLEQMLATNVECISNHPVGRWLQFDSAIRDTLPATYKQWEATVNKLIPLIESLFTQLTDHATAATMVTVDSLSIDRRWHHGLLAGQSNRGNVQFIGKTARQRARQQELANLAREMAALQSELEKLTHHLTQREARFEKFSADQEEIRTLLDRIGLSVRLKELKNTSISLSVAHKNHKEAQERTRKKRQEHNHLVMKLVKQSGAIVIFTYEHEKVRTALHETYELGPQIRLLQQELQALISLYNETQENQKILQDARIDQDENQTIYDTLKEQLIRYEAILEGLQEIVNSPELKDLTQKLEVLRTRAKQLNEDILAAAKDISTFTERRKSLSEATIQKEAELQTAQVDMRQKQSLFKDLLTAYPVPELQEACALIDEGKYAKAVQPLQINVYTLERLQQEQLDSRTALTTIHRTHLGLLHEYGPELDEKTSLITFSQTNGRTPFELLSLLESNSKKLQELLKVEEIKLFEGFLLRRMTEVLHKYIREAKEWVNKVNEPLQKISTVQDRYELEWQAKPRPEEVKLGSYLAKQQKLFSKPPMKLTEEERELLKVAFKQEINAIWHNHDESSTGMNFEQRLQAIFDYRQWFQFRVYITPKGGQKVQLTNKVLGARSGAERLFALLVPLLAAVTALYNRAAKGAPRLLALDEAFDRADSDNMKQFIEYLAGQDFQWIMTGPQLNISGTQIPVSVRYLMLHEKGSMVATAVPKIWKSNQNKNL